MSTLQMQHRPLGAGPGEFSALTGVEHTKLRIPENRPKQSDHSLQSPKSLNSTL